MERFVVRLGEFHATMSFLSAIGNMFRDAGLQVYAFSYMIVGN
jgi:hypothetical protein